MATSEPRQCFYIPVTQDPAEHGGFVPSLVIENERGHYPMLGRGEGAAPWIWGKTLKEAEQHCERFNRERFGIDEETAARIVASSMRR